MPDEAVRHDHLLAQLQQVAQGLADTFSPFCEVVVHDLTQPEHAILAIHNNLSGRAVGQPATELGLARIGDPAYPQVLANYANQFADGRPVKSTSIGIKDETGRYVAALCLNVDLSVFRGVQGLVDAFARVDRDVQVRETLEPAGAEALRSAIEQFARHRGTSPQRLTAADRRVLLRELKAAGHLEVRRGMDLVAAQLGVSRAAAYGYAKEAAP